MTGGGVCGGGDGVGERVVGCGVVYEIGRFGRRDGLEGRNQRSRVCVIVWVSGGVDFAEWFGGWGGGEEEQGWEGALYGVVRGWESGKVESAHAGENTVKKVGGL